MSDDDTERMLQQIFEQCVPDAKQRREITARLRIADLVRDPEVVAARQLLATATPAELDAAFALIQPRDTPAGTPAPGGARLTTGERLRRASETLKAGVAAVGEAFSDIFVATLTPMTMMGERGASHPEEASAPVEGRQSFGFVIPRQLAQLGGLEAEGSAELVDGALHIYLSRTVSGSPTTVAAIVVADGQVSEAVDMSADPTDPELLFASVAWPYPLRSAIDLLIALRQER